VRALRGEDIRKTGSGNIGATNVWRTYGARFGVTVMLLDTLKGFVPAFLATVYVGHLAGVLAGGAAMLGHWRPLFLRFERGGRPLRPAAAPFSASRPRWARSAQPSGFWSSRSFATPR
jgi:acyl phosphate:glycerol-3-phosphate acyltransferase